MLGRLLSIAIIVAVLFGGALTPAIAHAPDSGADHAAEFFHLEQTSKAHAPSPDDDGQPGKVLAHHHCPIAVEADVLDVETIVGAARQAAVPSPTRCLASLAQAPPTEPPAP